MLRLKKAGLVVCEAVMVLIVIGIVLSGNVEAETYKFVSKIPSQQWFFSNPSGVAVDSSGNVYVADNSNHRIQKFNSSGGFITKWGSYGSGDGQFNYPYGVAVGSSGNVYVADTGTMALARELESGPPLAYAAIKSAVYASWGDLEDALRREREGQLKLLKTSDVLEGVMAWAQKREPKFQGQ